MSEEPFDGARVPEFPDVDVPPYTMTRVPGYPSGLGTEVLEAQRSGTVEQIVVHAGVPLGPRGAPGPTGPTGPKGESTEWTVGQGPPPEPTEDDELGEIYLDLGTGNVWVLTDAGWVLMGNIMGPTGPTGPYGEPAYIEVGTVYPGGPGEAAVSVQPNPVPPDWIMDFVVPQGPTGPPGPPPEMVTGVVTSVGPNTAPSVSMYGSNGVYTIDWWLQQGPTGPAGTNIKIVGELPTVGPPSPTNPPDGSAANPPPLPGDGWVDSNDDVWVWSEELPGWINVGPVLGPPGATGPMGPPYTHQEHPLVLIDNGSGKAFQSIPHSFPSKYPFARVLLEDPPLSGVFTASQSAYIYYPATTEVRVEMDISMVGAAGKVILM